MSIAIIALLANLYLFNRANTDLALSRSLTSATNLATDKIAEFRAMTMTQIQAAAPNAPVPLPCPSSTPANPLNRRVGSDTRCPDCPDSDCAGGSCSAAATRFTRTWVVSAVDLDHHGTPSNECDDTPDMCSDVLNLGSCDVVEVGLDVTWTQENKPHRVTMTTFIAGKSS